MTGAGGPALTGLVVPVPEAEPVVGAHRARLDDSAALAVPAHVTVLFPFADPADLDEAALDRLAAAVASVPAFDHRFTTTSWFGDQVLWLAPEDPAPFMALTTAVHRAFPDHPPYGGAHGDDVVPHLTVGYSRPLTELRLAEAAVRAGLPLSGRASEVLLISQPRPGATFERLRTLFLGE